MTLKHPSTPEASTQFVQRFSLALTIAHVVLAVFVLLLSIQIQLGSIQLIAGVSAATAIFSATAFILTRRGRIKLATWLLISAICLGSPLISLTIINYGWIILIIVPLLITFLSRNALPQNKVPWAVGLSILSGFTGLTLDILGSQSRLSMPFPEITASIVIGLLIVLGASVLARQFSTYSLRNKLLVLFIVVALLPLGVLIFINNRTTRTALTDAANAALSSIAEQTGRQIDAFIEDALESIENEVQLPIFREALVSPDEDFRETESLVHQAMQVLLNENPEYLLRYSLLDREGRYITGLPYLPDQLPPFLGINQSILNSLQVALISNQPYVSPVILDPDTKEPRIFIAANINTEAGVPMGLLIATYDAGILQNIIEALNNAAGESSYGILYDEYHIQLAHGINPETNFKSLVPLDSILINKLQESNRLYDLPPGELTINYPALESGLDSSRQQPTFTLDASENIDKTSQVAVYRLNSRLWSVAFFQPQDIFLAPLDRQNRLNLALGFLFAGISTLAAMGASRALGAPITNLTVLVEQITKGDLTIRVPVTTRDEIGRLASSFNSMTTQIQNLLSGLESQVADRTQQLEKRAVQLQTAAEIAREASKAQDLYTLLNDAVILVNQRFNFYHAGIFLLDENKEFAVLRAANSEGGKQMLASGHKLKVGEVGIVGETTQTGNPHITLDVKRDSTHFAHDFLRETRSEMALPLKIGEEIIGALDVQSYEEGAFDEDDIVILQVLADQLAVAIRNSYLLAELQQTVRQLQAAYGDYTQRSWREWSQGLRKGYHYHNNRIEPVLVQTPEVIQAWESGQTITTSSDSQTSLAVPIKLRDTTLGVINLKFTIMQVPGEMVDLVNEIGNRLALALENARLLEATQERAARELLIGQVATRMRETLDVNTVLKTAVEEIRDALELHDITIQLELQGKELQ